MPDAALTQKMRRISSMNPREIAGRLREKGFAGIERLGILDTPDLPSIHFKSWLIQHLPRFYPGISASSPDPQWVERTRDEAERILRHEFLLLGLDPVQLGSEIDWHTDPYSGQRWEVKFWADYKPQDDPAGRDVKVVHELNRHQHLPRLAAAYLWTGDERYAEEAVRQIEDWIDENPVGYGINWQSSLEIAIRCVSWMWTMFPLLQSKAFSEGAAASIGRSLFAQVQHIARHLSTWTSPNTHLIGEATTLFLVGSVFEGHPAAASWLDTGAAILNAEVDRQIFDGAVYGELSSWYHCYTVDFYLQAVILGRQNGQELAPETDAALERMIQFLMHLTRPDGTLPLLGDDDGGRAFPLGRRDYRAYPEALALGAVLYRRPDFKHQAEALPEEMFWLLGSQGLDAWRSLATAAPRDTTALYPAAGYAIQRSGWDVNASHLIFDCGGLGILRGGHAHADSLSLHFASDGRAILIDPATFVYNCKPEWRAYFRSTAAHNTVTVDERDQVPTAGTFAWEGRLDVDARAGFTPGGKQRLRFFGAEHDGYASIGVTHRRIVLEVDASYWIVLDYLSGTGSHRFDFRYHFHPDVAPRLASNAGDLQLVAPMSRFSMASFGTSPLTSALYVGETKPMAGWASNGYGERHPIPTLSSRMTQDISGNSAGALTVIGAGSELPRVHRTSLQSGQGIACIIEHNGFNDLVVFAPDAGESTIGHLRGLGEFFWVRKVNGLLQDFASLRATHFEHDGTDLLKD